MKINIHKIDWDGDEEIVLPKRKKKKKLPKHREPKEELKKK